MKNNEAQAYRKRLAANLDHSWSEYIRTSAIGCLPSAFLIFSLVGCPKQPAKVTVPAVDPTPPSALWLQGDIPEHPLLNASPGSAPVQISLKDDAHVRFTARGDDPDGGVKEIRIWQSYSQSKPGLIQNATPGAPIAKDTSTAKVGEQAEVTRSVSYEFDLRDIKRPNFDTAKIEMWAEAENFSGGVTATPHITLNVSWLDLRLLAIALSDSDGKHAPNVTAQQFAQVVSRVNFSYHDTGIRFTFDPQNDWQTMADTELNQDGTNQRTRGNQIAQNNLGRILCLLRWGSDPANPTGNGNAYPPPSGSPTPPGITDQTQNYVALPNQIQPSSFLALGDGNFVAHELGHYLGLYHTFPGWSTADVYGAPPPSTAPAADQKVVDWAAKYGNSAFDGDLLSDTPPDPSPILYQTHQQNICQNSSISVTGTPSGGTTATTITVSFSADPGNVMGYYRNCIPPGSPSGSLEPPQKFSSQQVTKMNATVRGSSRSHLLP